MRNYTRQQELVVEIANYLTDWTSDDKAALSFKDSIDIIDSYGILFEQSCDELVINAIRHLDYIINPWNKNDSISEILDDVGFTKEEIKRYNCITDSTIHIVFGY